MTTDNKKSYLDYLNKLVDKYNNTYHHSTDKKCPVDADYSDLTEKMKEILNHLNLKLVIESELQSIKTFLATIILKIGQTIYLQLILY